MPWEESAKQRGGDRFLDAMWGAYALDLCLLPHSHLSSHYHDYLRDLALSLAGRDGVPGTGRPKKKCRNKHVLRQIIGIDGVSFHPQLLGG